MSASSLQLAALRIRLVTISRAHVAMGTSIKSLGIVYLLCRDLSLVKTDVCVRYESAVVASIQLVL